MTDYSVTEAKNRLPELIDRALAGEDVTITRHGHQLVEITPKKLVARRPVTKADIDWLVAHRVPRKPGGPNAGELVRQMRDEEWT